MTAPTLRIRDLFEDKVLVTRQAARSLETVLTALLHEAAAPDGGASVLQLTIDFDGVLGVAPSFVDELVSVFESVVATCGRARETCLVVANPPTRLSSKFEAIARGHQKTIKALPDNSWLLCDSGDAGAG